MPTLQKKCKLPMYNHHLGPYIDDCLCLGDESALTTAVQEIKNIFKVKITHDLDD